MHVTQHSHQGNCRQISSDKHTHTPGAAVPWVPNPSHWGAVIAAPLQTAASLLRGRASTGDKQAPGHANCHTSCKNTLPQIPKSAIALTGKEHPVLALPSHPDATRREELERGTKALQGTFSSREQKAATFLEQCSGLLGVVSPLNGVKSAQGDFAKSNP